MNNWNRTNVWYQSWRKLVVRLKTEKLTEDERDLMERSAILSNAFYVMALAEEGINGIRNRG